jgi:hypothetical protein
MERVVPAGARDRLPSRGVPPGTCYISIVRAGGGKRRAGQGLVQARTRETGLRKL